MSLGFNIPEDVQIWLYDAVGQRSMMLTLVDDLKIDTQLQGVVELSFTLSILDPRSSFIIPDGVIEYPSGEFWVCQPTKDSNPGLDRKVVAYPLWNKLSWRIRSGLLSLLGVTPEDGLTEILDNSGWTVGSVPFNAGLYSYENLDKTILDHIYGWATVCGYEVEFDTANLTVSFVDQQGSDKGLGFFYESNLLSIERTFAPPQITRLYPYGANSLTIASANPTSLDYLEDYSWYEDTYGLTTAEARNLYRKDYSWTDDRFLLAVNLYDAAVDYLSQYSQPVITYTISVFDLGKLTEVTTDDIEVGDVVRVEDAILGISVTTRIVRLTEHPKAPQNDVVELAFLDKGVNLVSSVTEQSRSIDRGNLGVLVARNEDQLVIGSSNQNWASISLTLAGISTPVLGGTFVGVATGSGTLEVWAAIDGTQIGEKIERDFTGGEQVEVSWPTYVADLAEGSYVLDWRAAVSTGTGTITLPAFGGRSWVLIQGAVGTGFGGGASQAIQEELDGLVFGTLSDSFTVDIDTP